MKNKPAKRHATLLTVAAGLACTAGHAQAPETTADAYVKRADANGDGVVSLYELRAAYYADPAFNQRIEQAFRQFDSDGDGVISARERRPTSLPAQDTMAPAAGPQTRRAPPPAPAPVAAAQANAMPAPEPALRLDARPLASLPASPTSSPPAPAKVASPPDRPAQPPARQMSRTEAWLLEIDQDRNGRASARELLASGNGQPWFTDAEFNAADRDDDNHLDAMELDALVRSLERRRR